MKAITLFFFLINILLFSQDKNLTGNYTINKGDLIIMEIPGGNISAEIWDKSDVVVNAFGIHDKGNSSINFSYFNGVLKVNLNSTVNKFLHADVRLSIPRNSSLKLSTNGGEVTIKGELSGNLSIESSGGNLRSDNINGNVSLITGGGDITVGNTTGELKAVTAGGNIRFGDAGKNVIVQTNGGDITGNNLNSTSNLMTWGGNIRIGNSKGLLKISTSGGDITTGYISGDCSANTLGGNIRISGCSGTLNVLSQGGDILISEVSGSVTATANSGTVRITFKGDSNSPSVITSNYGDVILYFGNSGKASVNISVNTGEVNPEFKDYISSEWGSTTENIRGANEKFKRNFTAFYEIGGGGRKVTVNCNLGKVWLKK